MPAFSYRLYPVNFIGAGFWCCWCWSWIPWFSQKQPTGVICIFPSHLVYIPKCICYPILMKLLKVSSLHSSSKLCVQWFKLTHKSCRSIFRFSLVVFLWFLIYSGITFGPFFAAYASGARKAKPPSFKNNTRAPSRVPPVDQWACWGFWGVSLPSLLPFCLCPLMYYADHCISKMLHLLNYAGNHSGSVLWIDVQFIIWYC